MLTVDSPLGRAGDMLDFAGGELINLSRHLGRALPLGGGRSGASMHFAGGGFPLAPADAHVPLVIPNWLAGYRNGAYMLDTFVQEQMTNRSDFIHRDQSSTNTYLYRDVSASRLSAAAEVQADTSTTTEHTQPLRVSTFIEYLAEQEADYPIEIANSRTAMNAVYLYREYNAFGTGGLFMTTTNWAPSSRVALGGTDNWGPPGLQGATSDPIRDMQTLQRVTFGGAIKMWGMNLHDAQSFFAHPKVVDWYASKGYAGVTQGIIRSITSNPEATQDDSPMIFDVPMLGQVMVHQARVTLSAAVAPDYFWPNGTVLAFVHAKNMPPNYEVCTAVTWKHTNPTAGPQTNIPGMANMPTNTGTTVRVIDMPGIGAGGKLIIFDRSEITRFTANNAGGIITGA